ncbi:MAG: hypothetical protein PHT33_03940 [bacterium]|nr:hypothetical protein [bacterium]
MKRLDAMIRDDQLAWLKRRAYETDCKVAAIVREAIDKMMEEEPQMDGYKKHDEEREAQELRKQKLQEAIEPIIDCQNTGINYAAFSAGDELADYLENEYQTGDEPLEISEFQRQQLREVYGAIEPQAR